MVIGADKVLLQRCGYEHAAMSSVLEHYAPFLGIEGNLAGKKILLKPNLISARGPSLACTDPRFMYTVARWFVDHGASVSIGDSPAFGTATGVLKRLDIHTRLLGLGVQVVEFTRPRLFNLPCDVRVCVAAEALDWDLFVNLPKVKAHNQMYVTIAVKNIFGIVKGLRKPLLHMKYGDSHRRFSAIILDLIDLLPPHITIADGIEVMHISGPLNGRPLPLRCIAGARNPLAVDTALLAALELPHRNSPLWLEAERRKCHGAMLSELEFSLLKPEAFHGSGFRAPNLLNPVRFNPFRFLRGTFRRFILALRP